MDELTGECLDRRKWIKNESVNVLIHVYLSEWMKAA